VRERERQREKKETGKSRRIPNPYTVPSEKGVLWPRHSGS
jgi:hypothetical protein